MLVVTAMSWGLTLADFDLLTIGMIIDLLAEFNARQKRANGQDTTGFQGVRKATQADFDRF